MTRSIYTTVTPLPPGITRAIVRECLHDHFLMIDLNPLVIKRERMLKALGKATPEEFHSTWYEITDRISYFPGVKGQVTYHGCFHDLDNGLQTHIYAPMGLDIKEKWTVGGSEPGEPRPVAELGINAPKDGLYIREDVDLTVNMMLLGFVKKNLVNAHKELVARMVEKTKILETQNYNESLKRGQSLSNRSDQYSPQGASSPSSTGRSSGPPQGFASQMSAYDDRFGPQTRSWYDPNTNTYQRPLSNVPPYESGGAAPYTPDQKAPFGGVRPPHPLELSPQDPPARYRMTLEEAANPHPQELPATKGPIELE